MSDSTKQKALVKLHAIVRKIGYPDKWKDYSTITIVSDDIVSNMRNTAAYNYNRDINKIGKPVDRTEWFETPPTIDAYYDPTQNNINFPAGILQPPFFYLDGDDAINYGGIGLVIGHEITHGFDDQGRQFDANGNLKDWWTADDAKKFKERAANIIRQYNGYVVVDTFHINGALTEGENLADNGGLAITYAAFKKTPQGKSDSLINGPAPDQRFFPECGADRQAVENCATEAASDRRGILDARVREHDTLCQVDLVSECRVACGPAQLIRLFGRGRWRLLSFDIYRRFSRSRACSQRIGPARGRVPPGTSVRPAAGDAPNPAAAFGSTQIRRSVADTPTRAGPTRRQLRATPLV